MEVASHLTGLDVGMGVGTETISEVTGPSPHHLVTVFGVMNGDPFDEDHYPPVRSKLIAEAIDLHLTSRGVEDFLSEPCTVRLHLLVG